MPVLSHANIPQAQFCLRVLPTLPASHATVHPSSRGERHALPIALPRLYGLPQPPDAEALHGNALRAIVPIGIFTRVQQQTNYLYMTKPSRER